MKPTIDQVREFLLNKYPTGNQNIVGYLHASIIEDMQEFAEQWAMKKIGEHAVVLSTDYICPKCEHEDVIYITN